MFTFKSWYVLAFCIMALLLMVIGLWSEVSWNIAILRTLIFSTVTTLLVVALDLSLNKELSNLQASKESTEGSNVDITVATDEEIYKELLNSDFQPMVPKQVDKDVNAFVKQDPEQAAELLRQLGIDE